MKKLSLSISIIAVAVLAAGVSFGSQTSATVPMVNEVISQKDPSASGTWADAPSYIRNPHSVSGDGRYVVFSSDATNLVPSDTNGKMDVFVRDTQSGTTTLASVSSAGVQGDNFSDYSSISHDGRFVVFHSEASTLVPGISSPASRHVYLRDLINQTTSIVDTSATGSVSAWATTGRVSADGRFVVFVSFSSSLVPGFTVVGGNQVFIKDMHSGSIKPVSVTPTGSSGNADSSAPDISCDGNTVVFTSNATNIAGGAGGSPGKYDLVVASLGWNNVELHNATASSSGGIIGSPEISCNGNVALFTSGASDIAPPFTPAGYRDVYQYNRLTKTTKMVSLGSSNAQADTRQRYQNINASMSDDGRYVAFASFAGNVDSSYPYTSGYTGGSMDIAIRDVKKSTTNLITILPSGYKSGYSGGFPALSPDGSKVAYLYSTPAPANPGRSLISGLTTGISGYSVREVYASETGL